MGLQAARIRADWVRRLLTLLTFASIYLILVAVLHLDLIFSRTTAAGGDMGSHHYVAWYLREHLLPRGQVTGWAPGWYAGIPMLTFYFPLPYVLIAALTPLLGDQVAFKLVTAAGLFALPLTCWAAFRVLRLREPAPTLAACAAVVFLFMHQLWVGQGGEFTIYGGNIASTMAGEFPFAISFALLPLALALVYRAVEEGGGWKLPALVVAAVVLSHILTTIVLVLACTMLLLRAPLRSVLVAGGRLARVFALAFCLTAFWGLPFLLRVQYTAHFQWTQLTTYRALFPDEIRFYLVFTVVGVVVALLRADRRILLFVWPALVATFVFIALVQLWPEAPLWNARLLPFIYLCWLLVAAYGAWALLGWLAGALRSGSRLPLQTAHVIVVVALVAAPLAGSWRHREFLPDWSRYNYSGFEAKAGWPEAQALFDTLRELPRGRVMWEFNRDYERFGTTRTLENVPVFAGQPTMEGLLIESSLNAPFHFINQKETSQQATEAVPGVDYPPGFDFELGLRHLRIFGVRYLVAYTDQVKQAAERAGLPTVTTSGRFTIYEVGDGHLVEVPRNRPVLIDHPDWRDNALKWYGTPEWLDTPLAFASREDPAARAAFADPGPLPATRLPAEPLAGAGPVPATMDGDVLEFTTDQVGVPHVVKVSWFPNWRAEGAEGPWMLSPGLMVVVPTQEQVRLVYRDTPVDLAGKGLSAAAVALLLVAGAAWWVRRRRA